LRSFLFSLSLHDALPICRDRDYDALSSSRGGVVLIALRNNIVAEELDLSLLHDVLPFIECVGCKCTFGKNVLFIFVVLFSQNTKDRKSTRLNSSHVSISY